MYVNRIFFGKKYHRAEYCMEFMITVCELVIFPILHFTAGGRQVDMTKSLPTSYNYLMKKLSII